GGNEQRVQVFGKQMYVDLWDSAVSTNLFLSHVWEPEETSVIRVGRLCLLGQAQQPSRILHDRRQPRLTLRFVVPLNRRLPFQATAKIATESLPLRPRRSPLSLHFCQPAGQLFDAFGQQLVCVLP